jgi:hypothetical protein
VGTNLRCPSRGYLRSTTSRRKDGDYRTVTTFLKFGIDFDQLDAQARAMSDNDAAEQMNAARSALFKTIFNRSKSAA